MTNCKIETFTLTFTAPNQANDDVTIKVGGRWCPPYYDADLHQIIIDLQEITGIMYNGVHSTVEVVAAKLGLTEDELREQILTILWGKQQDQD